MKRSVYLSDHENADKSYVVVCHAETGNIYRARYVEEGTSNVRKEEQKKGINRPVCAPVTTPSLGTHRRDTNSCAYKRKDNNSRSHYPSTSC